MTQLPKMLYISNNPGKKTGRRHFFFNLMLLFKCPLTWVWNAQLLLWILQPAGEGGPQPFSMTTIVQRHTTQLKQLILEQIKESNYHTVTWCFLFRWNTESYLGKQEEKKKYRTITVKTRGNWGDATEKETTADKDTRKEEAGMEAIKTILDIQASLLTLVLGRGGGFSLCDHGWQSTPPLTLQVAEKGTRVGLLLTVEK